MVSTAAQPLQPDFLSLKAKLTSKQSFEKVVQEVILTINTDPSCVTSEAFKTFVQRAMTILRTRCSDAEIPLWRSGNDLVRAALAASKDPAYKQTLLTHEAQCLAVLKEEPDRPPEEPIETPLYSHYQPQPQRLFEGQLSAAADLDPAPRRPGLEAIAPLLLSQMNRAALDSAQRDGSSGGDDTSTTTAPPNNNHNNNMSPEMQEALQRELDAIAVAVMEESAADAPRPPPPASKKIVKQLPREIITAERVADENAAVCSVCMCLEKGDEVSVLPCKHIFHPACLQPWLDHTNSCPTCRHELPTDDGEYERKKEREKDEAEERRGVENSLSHNEFMYI